MHLNLARSISIFGLAAGLAACGGVEEAADESVATSEAAVSAGSCRTAPFDTQLNAGVLISGSSTPPSTLYGSDACPGHTVVDVINVNGSVTYRASWAGGALTTKSECEGAKVEARFTHGIPSWEPNGSFDTGDLTSYGTWVNWGSELGAQFCIPPMVQRTFTASGTVRIIAAAGRRGTTGLYTFYLPAKVTSGFQRNY